MDDTRKNTDDLPKLKTLSAGQHRERLVPDKLLLNLIHNAMQHAEPDAGAIDVSLPADRPPGQAG